MKDDYKEEIPEVSDGSTNIDIVSERVERGERIVIQRLSCENETTAFTSLRLGIGGHGNPMWYIEHKSPAAATLYWDDEPIHLVAGEFLIARFTGTTNGDQLRLVLIGYREEVDILRGTPITKD